MCDSLTSTVLRIREPYEVLIHNISSHSETWTALEIRDGLRCDHRESEWLKGADKPNIRWRDEDDADTRQAVMTWWLRRWPTCADFIAHCLSNAVKVSSCRLSGDVVLPVATTVDASYCAKLIKRNTPLCK